MRLEKAGWIVAALVAVAALGPRAIAQGARQDADILPALLIEVRGLRQAMEQMASAGPRVQLTFGRLQLQEQRVNTMLRRLEVLREQVGGAERDAAQADAQIARLVDAIRNTEANTTVPAARRDEELRQVTLEHREVKRIAAQRAADAQRLQGEQALLEQQIANEQGRWAEINRIMEELERSLSKR